ncbi:tyrosine-type recombinase/integrase [Bacillus sp. 1P10SD]|uniref:site-specific integrase n=1 Tax=Bacillus sp. 1P10SD TaxID=3132265 RepID=UPI0039A4E222
MAHIEERGKNSYRLIVPLGFDTEGKRIRKTKTVKCKNKTEAEKELAKFVVEIETGEYIAPQKMTFSTFVEEWKEKYARKHNIPKTLENYMSYLEQRIIPTFGHIRVDQINTFQILNFLESLSKNGVRSDGKEGGLSSATIQFYHRILKNIFSRCVEWKVIKENPVANVKKPKAEFKKAHVFTEEQVHQLMEHLSNEDIKWRMIVTLAITTGMRKGEILGLEWKHIDLEKGKIYVQQALSHTKEDGYIFKEPKTKNSNRTISLSNSVVQQIKKYKAYKLRERLRMGIESDVQFLLFSSPEGNPMYPSSITTWWRKRLKIWFTSYYLS